MLPRNQVLRIYSLETIVMASCFQIDRSSVSCGIEKEDRIGGVQSRINDIVLPSARCTSDIKRCPRFLRRMSSIFFDFWCSFRTRLARNERSEDEGTAGCDIASIADL